MTNCILWANGDNQIYNNACSSPAFSYCDIQGCGKGCDGTGNWNEDFGSDGGNNIECDPKFMLDTQSGGAPGPDGVFATEDDGLRLQDDSPCTNAADGETAPSFDILGVTHAVPDMGAYEGPVRIVIMCWIDESDDSYHRGGGAAKFDTDLGNYRSVIQLAAVSTVKSKCFVPSDPNPVDPKYHPIEDVLPDGYSAPDEISIENCTRFPNNEDIVEAFNDMRAIIVPDYLLLTVDNSGSMNMVDIWATQAAYDNFLESIRAICPDIVVAPERRSFGNEQWLAEMVAMLEETVGDR